MLVGVLVVVKALVLFVLWVGLNIPGSVPSTKQVHAEEGRPGDLENLGNQSVTAVAQQHPQKMDYGNDVFLSIQKEREALREREESLTEREEKVRREEVRLQRVRQDIEHKLEMLAQIQTSLQELIEEKKSLENEVLKKLAKVYESTPPEQAGPMLSSLDVDLAAQILIRMDGRKAGKIWGYVSPDRASEISSEISRLQ
jgi:flagellar motility protein MotE (MotC chaperone)